MAIGNQASYSTSSLNTEIAQVAIDFHNAADHARDFFERVDALGVVGLKAIGFDDATANQFYTLADAMNTAAQVWFGQAKQSQIVNFDAASAAAR